MHVSLVEKKENPLSIKIKILSELKDEPALFLWEDSLSKNIKFIDKINLNKNVNYYSCISKNINFFENGISFKVVLLKTNECIYSYDFKNINFIVGKNILYISQNSYTGYSYAARNYIHQLLENGFNVKWDTYFTKAFFYQPRNDYEKKVFLTTENSCNNFDSVIVHHTPDAWSSINNLLSEKNITFKKIYGLTTWETTKLHKSWVEYINNSVDEVIVPSSFNVETFKNSGVNKKINLWYHDIFPFYKTDVDVKQLFETFCFYKDGKFINDSNTIKDIVDNNTVYYNISQYCNRKNINQLINVFCKKFNSNNKVCLFIKTNIEFFSEKENDFLKYKFHNIIKNYTNPPLIIFCFNNLTNDQIDLIHEFGDVYITLNRGEGFGLSTYTAKKIGNKIICGKFGAEKEYLDDSDILLDYSLESARFLNDFNNYYLDDEQKCAFYDTDYVVSKLPYFPKVKKQLYNYNK